MDLFFDYCFQTETVLFPHLNKSRGRESASRLVFVRWRFNEGVLVAHRGILNWSLGF